MKKSFFIVPFCILLFCACEKDAAISIEYPTTFEYARTEAKPAEYYLIVEGNPNSLVITTKPDVNSSFIRVGEQELEDLIQNEIDDLVLIRRLEFLSDTLIKVGFGDGTMTLDTIVSYQKDANIDNVYYLSPSVFGDISLVHNTELGTMSIGARAAWAIEKGATSVNDLTYIDIDFFNDIFSLISNEIPSSILLFNLMDRDTLGLSSLQYKYQKK